MDVVLRRRFGVDRGRLTAMEDEHLREPDQPAPTAGSSVRTRPCWSSVSMVACPTRTSPSEGSTAPMWSRKARLGPTTSTPERSRRSRKE